MTKNNFIKLLKLLVFVLLFSGAVYGFYEVTSSSSFDSRSRASESVPWPPVSPKPKPPCSTDPSVCPEDDGTSRCDTMVSKGKTMYCPKNIKPVSCKSELYSIPNTFSLDNLDFKDIARYKLPQARAVYMTSKEGERFVMRLILTNTTRNIVNGDFYAYFPKDKIDHPYKVISVSTTCNGPKEYGSNSAVICKQPNITVPVADQVVSADGKITTPRVYTEIYQVIEMGKIKEWFRNSDKKSFQIGITGNMDGVGINCGNPISIKQGSYEESRCYGGTLYSSEENAPEKWCRQLP